MTSKTPLRFRAEVRQIGDLVPYERNNKPHPQSQIDSIKASIERFGFNDPIGVTEGGVIVEGHGRVEAARQLGITEVSVIVLPDNMTEDMIDLYRIAHNKLALTSNFDFAKLAEQLREIVEGGHAEFGDMGFDSKAVSSLFAMVHETVPVGASAQEMIAPSENLHEFDIVWDSAEQRDRFKAFTAKVVAVYGGGSGDAMAACLADAVSGNLVPSGLVTTPPNAAEVGDLTW